MDDIKIRETNIDNRVAIEVFGKDIVLSAIVGKVENKFLNKSTVEEVRFIVGHVFKIDANLENDVWKGRNVVVVANEIKVCGEVCWNLSGKDSTKVYTENAGTESDGHGKQGRDGEAGESGGNVFIRAKIIENVENLKIISNGGMGGAGQDGGNGVAGKNGRGMTKVEFDETFPPVATFFDIVRLKQFQTTLLNFKRMAQKIQTQWAHRFFFEEVTNVFHENVSMAHDVFIEVITKEGYEITYSYAAESVTANCQAFLVCKGSPGENGKPGGECGLGGKGGFPGEITIECLNDNRNVDVKTSGAYGKDGMDGKGGLNGKHGTNGWDIGYMDYAISQLLFCDKWPKYYGGDQKSKLSIEYYSSNNSDRVYCPYKYRSSNDCYAEIKTSQIEHPKQQTFKERNNTRTSTGRQRHAMAVGKKTIPKRRILETYSEYFSLLEKEQKSLNLKVQAECDQSSSICMEYDAMLALNNEEQTIQQMSNVAVKRVVNFHQTPNYHHLVEIHDANQVISNVDAFNKWIHGNFDLDEWVELKTVETDRAILVPIMHNFSSVKAHYTATDRPRDRKAISKVLGIEQVLLNKYKRAVLQKMSSEQPPYWGKQGHNILTAENATRYLVEGKPDFEIAHPSLGSLKQYLFDNNLEQRKRITAFAKTELTSNDVPLQRAVGMLCTFEKDLATSEIASMQQYVDDFEAKQKAYQAEVYTSLINALRKPEHKEILHLWNESIDNESLETKLELKIKQNTSLQKLYVRYKRQDTVQHDWGKCCADEKVLKIFFDRMRDKGMMSEAYRELLAYVYNVNILVYDVDHNNEMHLKQEHNAASTQAVTHLLLKGDKFIQLKIDEHYHQLEQKRYVKDQFYERILIEMESSQSRSQIDNVSGSIDSGMSYKTIDEETAITNIGEFFLNEERNDIKTPLHSIRSDCTDQEGILKNILLAFISEGRHVSYNELCFLINSFLSHCADGNKERYLYSWIIAAYPQSNWVDEMILLELENRFRKQLPEKSKWRNWMSKITNKNVLLSFAGQFQKGPLPSVQCVNDILHLLSSIPIESICLNELDLSGWPYMLKEYYWMWKLKPLTVLSDSDDISSASYNIMCIENMFGIDLAEKLLLAFQKKRSLTSTVLVNLLANIRRRKWSLSKEDVINLDKHNLDEWINVMEQKYKINHEELTIGQLVAEVRGNSNTSSAVLNHLLTIEKSITKIANRSEEQHQSTIAKWTAEDIIQWAKNLRKSDINKQSSLSETYKKLLIVIDRAIELKRNFRLRNTQRLTVLSLLSNSRSTLAQVSTGEGKSLIVVATAIVKSLLGEKVDIVTSSSVLAKRDATVNKDIYDLFGVSVSHNCSEDVEDRKEAYSLHQVVYGDLSNFQRDYLLDRFYGKHILGDRSFENVIVDEVDSMLLDKGNNMLYLSHDIPGMDKLEVVYIFIWQMINCSDYLVEDELIQSIEDAVLSDMYVRIQKTDLRLIDNELSDADAGKIWKCLIKGKLIDDNGNILLEPNNSTSLDGVLSSDMQQYKDRLCYLLKEEIGRERQINVPNFLKPFVERHLRSWIISARNALCMAPDEYYVVDVDRSGANGDRNANITILDRDTGTDQISSQWDEALHQFLQLKHGCKLSMQSLKAVFISNVAYFKKYQVLYGLTGTLGSERERDLLKEIHKVDFVTIPTAKSKQFEEYEPIKCSSKERWKEQIRIAVDKIVRSQKRSVLVICETIDDVNTLHAVLKGNGEANIQTYERSYKEFDVAQGSTKLDQGQIIIATNLAGRGTDIQISDQLRQAGGLHVCLTYLPENVRIEEQAFGRAARCGDKGSGQMIAWLAGENTGRSRIFELKMKRDVDEVYRLSSIKTHYETTIQTEERCFKAFQEVYERNRSNLDDDHIPEAAKDILLKSCLDKWSFWLDEHSSRMNQSSDEAMEINVTRPLHQFLYTLNCLPTGRCEISFDTSCWSVWVKENPMKMIKLGVYFTKRFYDRSRGTALNLFSEVIKSEPKYAEAAYYYRAYVLSTKIDWQQNPIAGENKKLIKDFKQDLRCAAKLFEERINFAMNASGVVEHYKATASTGDGFEEQKKSIIHLYNAFSSSIKNILGHNVDPQSFESKEINNINSGRIFDDLVERGYIKSKVRKNISEKELQTICASLNLPMQCLKTFLSANVGTVDHKQFIAAARKSIPLPSREEFWETLVANRVLINVVRYVVIDNNRLTAKDPSIMEAFNKILEDGKLFRRTITAGNDQTILYHERAMRPLENEIFFEKVNLMAVIGKQKYDILENAGLFMFNEKATIDRNAAANCQLASFDSLTLEDITDRTGISIKDAKGILKDLVDSKVLVNNNGTYRLGMNFSDEGDRVLLPSQPVYEDAVMRVISTCFAYRLALNRITRTGGQNDCPIQVNLKSNPHKQLFLDLLKYDMVRPPRVVRNWSEKQLKEMYNSKLSLDSWNRLLAQELLIPEQLAKTVLETLLVRKFVVSDMNWLETYLNVFDNPAIVGELLKRLVDDRVGEFKLVDKDSQPILSEICLALGANKNQPPRTYNIVKSLEKFMEQQRLLTNEGTTKHIASLMNKYKSALKDLKVPNGNLKSIAELFGKENFGNSSEIQEFNLNGLEHLLEMREKRWTVAMISNCAGVICLGIAQIIVGALIEMYSAGLMTHVGSGFIGEGVGDIMFAVSCFRSGHFSWGEYRQQKMESLLMTVGSAGVGAMFSQGAKLSRIGYKLMGPSVKVGNKKVAETVGKRLMKVVTTKAVRRETAKRIVFKIAEGVAIGAANVAVDELTERQLKPILEDIASKMMSDLKNDVASHNVSQNLKKAYDLLGAEDARSLVDELTNKHFGEQNTSNLFVPEIKQVVSLYSQGLANAAKKDNSLAIGVKIFGYVSKLFNGIEYLQHLQRIRTVATNLLDNVNKELSRKLNELEKSSNRGASTTQTDQDVDANYDMFQKEVIAQWQSMLSTNVGQMVAQHFVCPLVKTGVNQAVFFVGKTLKNIPRNLRESESKREITRLTNEHKQVSENPNMPAKIKQELTDQYHAKLRKIMSKTRNPSIFAHIIREGVPMDLTCVSACAYVVNEVLQKQGIPSKGLTITVDGEKGIQQTFAVGEGGPHIALKLDRNHFSLCGSSEEKNVSGNNCLFGSLAQAFPALNNLSPDEFRLMISKQIECNGEIRNHIKQGWHKLPIELYNTIGGKKGENDRNTKPSSSRIKPEGKPKRQKIYRTAPFDDDSSSIHDLVKDSNIKKPDAHLISRIYHTVRFAGELRSISELTNIPVKDLIKPGGSIFKEKKPSGNQDFHQSHVVRLKPNYELLKDYPEFYHILSTHTGHTQLVEKFVNISKIGKLFDDYQFDWIIKLTEIDFSKGFTEENQKTLDAFKASVTKVFTDVETYSKKYTAEQKGCLERSKNTLEHMCSRTLFEKGNRGFKLDYNYEPISPPTKHKSNPARNVKRSRIKKTENEE